MKIPSDSSDHFLQLGISNVLLIDDIMNVLHSTRRIFKMAGIPNVDIASNCQEAKELLTKAQNLGRQYDVIFLDYHMPDMLGTKFIGEILSIERFQLNRRYTGIFMLSGETDPQFRDAAKMSGAIDFIQKPTSASTLLQICEKWARIRTTSS